MPMNYDEGGSKNRGTAGGKVSSQTAIIPRE